MSVPKYSDNGPLDVSGAVNLDNLKGKSVIITGGMVKQLMHG